MVMSPAWSYAFILGRMRTAERKNKELRQILKDIVAYSRLHQENPNSLEAAHLSLIEKTALDALAEGPYEG